jgi:sorting nexin-1/2
MEIYVCDPQKLGEGLHSYMSYKINTRVHNHDNDDKLRRFQKESSMIRRYNDFVWLHQQLEKEYPGLIIPHLPEKLAVGRFSEEFVKRRQRALEQFLNRTAAHTELVQSEDFRLFLEADDTLLKSRRKEQSSSSSIGGVGGYLMKSMLGTMQSISTSLTSSNTGPKTQEDVEFDEVSLYIEGLEKKMQVVYKHTHSLAKRNKDIANGLREFSGAFKTLGKSEAGELGIGLTQMSVTMHKLSILSVDQAEQEIISFEEPIQDYLRIIAGMKFAVAKRSEAKAAWDAARAELDTKQKQADMSAGDLQKAQAKVDTTRAQYDVVSTRVASEVHRFKESKRVDFKIIVNDFIQAHILYAQKVEAAWQSVIPQLQAIQVGQNR